MNLSSQTVTIEDLPVGIFELDYNKQLLDANLRFCKLSGRPKSKLLGDQWINTIHPDDKTSCIQAIAKCLKYKSLNKIEFRFKVGKKKDIWIQCHLAPQRNKKKIIGLVFDINDFKQTEAALQKLASFDPLTKLPNRYFFEEILTKCLMRSLRNDNTLALFYLDVDFFKNVNDFFGHGIGDKFLIEVGHRLKENIRVTDYLVRLGGDEFAIILEDISNIHTISFAAKRIINAFKKPFMLDKNEIMSSVSIGISVYPDEKTNEKTIIQHADQALYQAKTCGRACYKYYNKMMQHQLERYMLITEYLHHAISENQFELYYQPKINLETQSLVGMEALLRWHNPVINSSPDEFITIAEETGLMNEIGDWGLGYNHSHQAIQCMVQLY
ncbi:MAG: GGDEF domain-containing protein [Legionella sp.]|nr:GGDEF domain-containing protein [Legionella sp.]